MRTVTLGTAGHIDHGKTALVRALTGIDTDRLPEEKRRGITIDLGFAHLDLEPGLRLAITDVPGHEAFIRNMAAGASGIDLGLLVVAADEGIKPQTREHLDILRLLNVPLAAVALTKADLTGTNQIADVRAAVAQLINAMKLAQVAQIAVSAHTAQGLAELRETLKTAAARVTGRAADDLFRMPIDRVFTVRGTGTVVTGTVWSGSLEIDQGARLLPSGARTRVRALQRQKEASPAVSAGDRAAVALAGISTSEIRRGETLVTDPQWAPARTITALLHNLPTHERAMGNRQRVHLHVGTATVLARVRALDQPISPGENGWAVLQLEQPTVVRAGDRFILRSFSPVTTIAGGQIVDWSEKNRRRRAEDIPRLETLRTGGALAQIDAALAMAGWAGLDAGSLALHVGKPIPASKSPLNIGGRYYHQNLPRIIGRRLLDELAELHQQFPLRDVLNIEQLRERAPAGATRPMLDFVITQLAASGRISLQANRVALAGWHPHVSPAQATRMRALMQRLEQQGLSAPTITDLKRELGADIPDLARRLAADGALTQLNPDLFVTTSSLSVARAQVTQILTAGPATPSEIKAVLGLSRKHLIPLLEYFDRSGFTRRIGDHRTLAGVEAVSDVGDATR